MLKTITPINEEHWLDMRKFNINSTEAAALFGMSPYQTPYELYHLKTGNIEDSFIATERTRAGKALEEAIAQFALTELQLSGKPMKDYYFDDVVHMGSSFDWEITSEGQYKDWILEIKNVDKFIYANQWVDDEAPEHIEVQVQHQMELADRPGTIICAMVGGNQLKFIYRPRDTEMGAGIRQAIKSFWEGVASGYEPAPDYAADKELVIKMHQKAGHETLDATTNPIIGSLLEEYHSISQLYSNTEKAKDAKKAEILDVIGDKYLKVMAANGYSLSCGMTKDTEPTIITPEMVGTTYGGRKGYRQFRLNVKK